MHKSGKVGDGDFDFGEDMVYAVEMNELQNLRPVEVVVVAIGDCIGFEEPDPGQMEDSAETPAAMEVSGVHANSLVRSLRNEPSLGLTENVHFSTH